jgi:hypothetical protein
MIPRDLGQLESFAKTISQSKLCPKSYRGQPQDVTLAILYGMEVGLRPLQSLQSVAVINGRPAIYGDAALALVEQSGLAEYVKEWQEQAEEGGLTAYCEAKKKGKPEPTRQSFSWQEAQEAGLTNKGGPWQDYPRRMLQMRARSWALRDTFPEVLEGLYIAEEAEAIPADESETIDPGGMMDQSGDGAPESSGDVDVEYVQSHGITVTKPQAEKIEQRDDALEERNGDELAAAIVAVEEEMEDWPSEALCEACDAMLDDHRQRLEESDSGKAEGASLKKQSEKPTKGSQQSDSPTTSPQKDEGAEDNGVQDPDEVKEAAQGVETASDEANDPEFESDDDLPF